MELFFFRLADTCKLCVMIGDLKIHDKFVIMKNIVENSVNILEKVL